jgi:hypothetical protein
MLSTSALRREWGPDCFPSGGLVRVALHGEGVVPVRPEVVPAVRALDACFAAHDYRTRRADCGAWNCRRITGGNGLSLHSFGIALDINWSTNPYGPRLVTDMPAGMIADIEAIRTVDGLQVWRWGGRYRDNKDAMHFEVVVTRAQLARGLAADGPPTEENLMPALSDAEQREILAKIRTIDARTTTIQAAVASLAAGVGRATTYARQAWARVRAEHEITLDPDRRQRVSDRAGEIDDTARAADR